MPLRPTEPRTVVREFGPVWVWREDLEEIISVMRQVAPDLVLQADAYNLDEIDDLRALDEQTVNSFKATSRDSRIRLTLGAKEASISADDPDLTTRGMLEEVHRIATRHNRPKYRERFFFAVEFCGFAGFFAAIPGIPSAVAVVLLTISIIVVGLGVWGLLSMPPRHRAVIYTRTRTEAPLWLVRNRDALVTNAIVSAVFLVVGILIGIWLPS